VSRLLPDANQALAVPATLLTVRRQEGAIDLLEREALAQVRLRPAYRQLQSVSGIGQVLGLTIMLETGPIARFAAAGHYASYCRCVGSERLSNGKRKGGGNTKNGNKYTCLKRTLRPPTSRCAATPRSSYYQRKRAKSNGVIAIKTVAHKLARACYHMLREGTDFDVAKAFGRTESGRWRRRRHGVGQRAHKT
jgi:transposase